MTSFLIADTDGDTSAYNMSDQHRELSCWRLCLVHRLTTTWVAWEASSDWAMIKHAGVGKAIVPSTHTVKRQHASDLITHRFMMRLRLLSQRRIELHLTD